MNARVALLRRLQGQIPAPPVDEPRLLRDVGTAYPELEYADLDTPALQHLTAEHGVDFATALLYDRIGRCPDHAAFIRAVESLELDLDQLPRLRGTALIVPAPFYRELPEFGGDGRLVSEIAEALGLRAEVARVPSVGSVSAAAAIVHKAILAHASAGHGPLVVVSMSKGGADVRAALETGLPTADIAAWVQVCGLVRGSPLASRALNAAWPRRLLLDGFLRLAGGRLESLQDLSQESGALLAGEFAAPPGLLVINVVGFPLAAHLAGTTRRRHATLARLGGPNDGATLLRDAIVEPGLIYPVWSADHYLRVPHAAEVIYRLFLYLAQRGVLAPEEWSSIASGR